jgi:hypothetical protein
MGPADEEAGDPPVGKLIQAFAVRLLVLDPGQLTGRSELAPADAPITVVDERGVGAALAHPASFLARRCSRV